MLSRVLLLNLKPAFICSRSTNQKVEELRSWKLQGQVMFALFSSWLAKVSGRRFWFSCC